MIKQRLLSLLGMLVFTLPIGMVSASPNIVLILTDDHGWSQLSERGGRLRHLGRDI